MNTEKRKNEAVKNGKKKKEKQESVIVFDPIFGISNSGNFYGRWLFS